MKRMAWRGRNDILVVNEGIVYYGAALRRGGEWARSRYRHRELIGDGKYARLRVERKRSNPHVCTRITLKADL